MNIRDFLSAREKFCLFLTGQAASGKTTLVKSLSHECPGVIYLSLDDYFIGDSSYRKSRTRSLVLSNGSLRSHITMTDWWDWNLLCAHIVHHKRMGYYKILVDGAVLPSPVFYEHFDSIFFLLHPENKRFRDLFKRDSAKRSQSELVTRLQITNYAEALSYCLFLNSGSALNGKLIVAIDRHGERITNIQPIGIFLARMQTSIDHGLDEQSLHILVKNLQSD